MLLRVTTVAKLAGCATSVLYHYFGSRDGLIDAAYIEIAASELEANRAYLEAASETVLNADDVVRIVIEYVTLTHDTDRAASTQRARLLGAAQSRPPVRHAMQSFEILLNATYEELFQRLRSRRRT